MTIHNPDAHFHAEAGEGEDAPRGDLLQAAFWLCLIMAVAAASLAIAWPEAGGTTGPMLLISMGLGGLVFLLWVARGAGRKLGLFPDRGAAAAAAGAEAPRFAWIEALEEAVLICDRGGAPLAANDAYRALMRDALVGQPDHAAPVLVDRIFSASPGLAAPVFRLSKAARAGETRHEVLPALTLGNEAEPVQFEAIVTALPNERVMWRLRRLGAYTPSGGASDAAALYVEDAPIGFFVTRSDGSITYANAWMRELIGVPETARNIRIDDIMRPEFMKRLKRDRRTGAPARVDLMVRTRDGVEIPVQTVTTWTGKGAQAVGRTIVMSGASGKSEARLTPTSPEKPARPVTDPMFEDAPFGAARLEGQSVESAVIVEANRALREISGERSVSGASFATLFSESGNEERIGEKLLGAIDKPVGLTLQGDEPKNVNVFVSLNEQCRPSVAYIIDMTEQKQLEMRLAQGEKMQAIGQLAGGVAHDFNNVLTGIMLNNDSLMTRHPVGDPSYENLRSIHEFSVRAKDLVQMLLAYARKQTFRREVIDVSDFLSEFAILLRQILDERIGFDVHHGRDLPAIKADRNQIETAIINLVTNARDAMLSGEDPGGKLTIRTERATGSDAHEAGFHFVEEGDYLLIEVCDTGHGIPPEILDEIFQPFFTTKDPNFGTGLGLATVYGIIKQSGGYICPISEVGRGTTFQIYLPALAADEMAEPEPEPVAEKARHQPVDISGRGRILIVEDEDGVRGIAATLLESRGYEVEQAPDGEEALEILEDNPGAFDLIISDVVMPGMDGPTMIREAKEYLGKARIVFISGYAERDLAQQLDDDREVSFLPKPFTVRQLAERVKEELGGSSQKAA